MISVQVLFVSSLLLSTVFGTKTNQITLDLNDIGVFTKIVRGGGNWWKLSNKMPTTHPKYSHYEGKADQYGVYSREHSDAIYDIVTADFFNELDKLEKIENAYYTDDSLSD
ncbi:uncharacterized protein LOC126840922 isoform X1 [Adelges cooleyi]|uniref:uncharacterized protein LOC126840922 isoform X1 n=1 Tax=Adelges cooleyi TaxID=133065 RepID=UPI00217FA284|nr:uncharacterized protein LOC126840922 isoform X1 [Adelges cooleyi]